MSGKLVKSQHHNITLVYKLIARFFKIPSFSSDSVEQWQCTEEDIYNIRNV